MNVLVTGATGFIGSHLVEALLKKHYQVHCLIRKTSDLRWIKNLNIQIHETDFRDKKKLCRILRGKDYIFHLAAVIQARNWDTYFRVNVGHTQNLVRTCIQSNPRLKKFILVSSIAAAGPTESKRVVSENDGNHPRSDYGKSKLLAEETVLKYRKVIPVAVIRPPNVIGPRQKELWMVIKMIKRRLIPMMGNGDQQTSLCYVEDLVQALLLAAEKAKSSGEIYFVTDSCFYSWQDIIKEISHQLGIRSPVVKIPFGVQLSAAAILEFFSMMFRTNPLISRQSLRATRQFYWLYDDSKIRSELGYTSRTTIKDGIGKTIRWYQSRNLI